MRPRSDEEIRPWSRARRSPPRGLALPRWLAAAVAGAVAVGPIVAVAMRRAPWQRRLVRMTFFSAAFGYLATSLVDFAEHFRLEKRATGRWLSATVVPPGETLNHAATVATVVGALARAQPLATSRAQQAWSLLAPALFLALGWRDEFVYHRRRSTHREDMMHTIPHLAAGVMWTALYAMRALEAPPPQRLLDARAAPPR